MTRVVPVAGLAIACAVAGCLDAPEDGLAAELGVLERLGRDSLSGVLAARVLDARQDATVQYALKTSDGERVVLRFADPPAAAVGETIDVIGTRADDGSFAVESVRRQPTSQFRDDAPLVRTPRHHRVAILAMQEAEVSESQAFDLFHAKTNSVADFYAEVTHGVDTFSAELFRSYAIVYDDTNCQFDNTDDISNALVAAFEADGYGRSDYDHIVTVVPDACGADWDGAWADIGAIADDGEVAFEQISMYKDSSFDPWYLSHELGHNLGMNHSGSFDCGQSLYKANAKGCDYDEYGDYNDVMGWGEGVYFGVPHQRFMGWIGAEHVATAEASGLFNLHASDGDGCGIRAVRVPIPGESSQYFYIEYRYPRADSAYAGTGEVGEPHEPAALVSRSRDGRGDQSLTARLEFGGSRYEGMLPGERYQLGDGVAIVVASMSGPVARVAVELARGAGEPRLDDGTLAPLAQDGSVGFVTCRDDGSGGDACPDDPVKVLPGECGCGVPEGTCGEATTTGTFVPGCHATGGRAGSLPAALLLVLGLVARRGRRLRRP